MKIKTITKMIKCPICGHPCKGSTGLGGHMGKHKNAKIEERKKKGRLRMKNLRAKRRREAAAPIVIKNPVPAPTPQDHAVLFNPLSQWSTKTEKSGRGNMAVIQLRQAAADYRRKADELEKLAQRAEQLM